MSEENHNAQPRLVWEMGTAYDLFISLNVLHKPAFFGLRGAWAAGVRSRLPIDHREFLEAVADYVKEPYHWLVTLPQPKDSATVLYHLGQVPAEERLRVLTGMHDFDDCQWCQTLSAVAERRAWGDADKEALRAAVKVAGKSAPSTKYLEKLLDWWVSPGVFGERYLEALRTYHEVFFAEEEYRIRPALQQAVERVKEQARNMALADILEELSGGLQFDNLEPQPELLMIPSFWITPRVIYMPLVEGRDMFIFGARRPEDSLVPGEPVPDALLQSLKALSDPTRLRILRYLAAKPQTPAQLARRLRLRPPTVTHHLDLLRLAGLVSFAYKGKLERQYSARHEAINRTFVLLSRFLAQGEERDITEPGERNQVW